MLVSFQFSNSNLLRNNSYINIIQSPFKVYNLVGVCVGGHFLFYLLVTLQGMWDLSSLTKNQTPGPLHRQLRVILSAGPPGKALSVPFFISAYKGRSTVLSLGGDSGCRK